MQCINVNCTFVHTPAKEEKVFLLLLPSFSDYTAILSSRVETIPTLLWKEASGFFRPTLATYKKIEEKQKLRPLLASYFPTSVWYIVQGEGGVTGGWLHCFTNVASPNLVMDYTKWGQWGSEIYKRHISNWALIRQWALKISTQFTHGTKKAASVLRFNFKFMNEESKLPKERI